MIGRQDEKGQEGTPALWHSLLVLKSVFLSQPQMDTARRRRCEQRGTAKRDTGAERTPSSSSACERAHSIRSLNEWSYCVQAAADAVRLPVSHHGELTQLAVRAARFPREHETIDAADASNQLLCSRIVWHSNMNRADYKRRVNGTHHSTFMRLALSLHKYLFI